MPDRLYNARNHPPSVGDRIYAHWLEMTLAVMGILRGGLSIVADHLDFIERSVDRIPEPFGIGISLALIAGGLVWIWSVVVRFDTLNRFYLILRTGLGLVALGWFAHLAAAIIFAPTHVLVWSVTLSTALATSGLYVLSFLNERTIRREEAVSSE